MTDRNYRLRFGANNFAEDITPTSASAMSGFPITNLTNQQRSLVYRPNGNFTIGATNDEIYINDGTDKTVSLTNANYSGGAALASHIQTQLNASSTNWTCTYSTTTNKFTIARSSGTDTLRFTQTTNAAWDTLGYTTATDESAATHGVADVARIHTDEWIKFDLGTALSVTEFHLISPLSMVFPISTTATLQLQGNASDVWTSPTIDVTPVRDKGGIHHYLDDIEDTSFRYWRFRWVDRTNTVGGQGFHLGHVYLGDYVTCTTTNVATGFGRRTVDPSERFESDAGALFHRSRTKFRIFEGLSIGLMDEVSERQAIEDLFDTVGIQKPFYLSLDPLETYSTFLSEMTAYCRFQGEPQFQHVIRDIYSLQFAVREAI